MQLNKVSLRAVDDLRPFKRNARTHPEEQIDAMMTSIAEFGWTQPVLIDKKGTILAGHCRVIAAERLGIQRVPCMVIGARWTAAQKRAYVIADNKLAARAKWDMDILKGELLDLQKLEFNLDLTGFDADEIAKTLGQPVENEETVTIEPAFQVLIECKDEAEQREVLAELTAKGVNCRALIA